MQSGAEILKLSAGEVFERDFIGECEIVVKRDGYSRARHSFIACGRTIARLRWRGMRRAIYECDEGRMEITVSVLDKKITVITDDGSESFLIERSPINQRRAGLRIEMAEGDNFRLKRSWDSRFRSDASYAVQKEFYASTLMVCRFNTVRRTQTTVQIDVNAVMKWESRFIHRLLALIVSWIILERRHSGSRPIRTKEKPRGFVASARVRERKLRRG